MGIVVDKHKRIAFLNAVHGVKVLIQVKHVADILYIQFKW